MKKIVIKIGTSSLTNNSPKLSRPQIAEIVRQIAHLHSEGYQIVIVSSGAIAAGRQVLASHKIDQSLPSKQMLASVGQLHLMDTWTQLFAIYDITIGQILLTKGDFSDAKRAENAKNTFLALLNHRFIPIVNENDSVATDEIRVGDNDNLSAYVAQMIQADLLVLLTDQAGLYTADPRHQPDAKLIETIDKIDDYIASCAQDANPKGTGTGGMTTKIQAAKTATLSGTATVIASSKASNVLLDLIAGKKIGTYFAI